MPKHTQSEKSEYPMRINKYLAHSGYSTRRGADTLVQKGLVFINGKPAVLGSYVREGDDVEVKVKNINAKYVYYAFNKPRGVLSHSATDEEDDVVSLLPKDIQKQGVFPLGRLDKDSHGLMIVTNDGRLTERLLSPEFEHEKEYIVKTRSTVSRGAIAALARGVDIEGYMTRPSKIKSIGDKTLSITLTEGKKHQIRRMLVAVKNDVVDLKRVRIMTIGLSPLKEGDIRPLTDAEKASLLAFIPKTPSAK